MPGRQANRRIELRETADVRAKHTRDRLVDAYRSSVLAASESVSVLAVCRTAGVARSTFYSHFATLEDLAVATVADAFTAASPADVRRRTAHETSSADITRESVTQMIVTLEDLRTVVLMTTRMASRAAVVERLIAAMTEAVRSAIEVEDSDLEEPALALTADFVAAGTVYATLRWLEQDERDRQAIIDHLMNLLPAVLVGGAR